MSKRSGSKALQPKIPKNDFEKLSDKIREKDLLNELYECDENYCENKFYLLKNKNELKYAREQITDEEKTNEYARKTKELLKQISKAVEILFKEQTFDSDKRNWYLSPSNTFPGYTSCLIFNFTLKSHHSRWSKVF